MARKTKTCNICSLYNKGLEAGFDYLRLGEVSGCGKIEFYLEKFSEYPVREGESGDRVTRKCASCENLINIYEKDKLKSFIGSIKSLEGFLIELPPDLQTEITKLAGEFCGSYFQAAKASKKGLEVYILF